VDRESAPLRAQRLPALDVLRGIAMVGVVTVHTLGPFVEVLPPVRAAVLTNGRRGVQLFLVVSVVLALRTLEARREPAVRYLTRRWLRLAPLFYLALAVTLARYTVWPRHWPPGSPPVTPVNIAAHAAFVFAASPWWINSVMGIEWALGVLALFYLAAPALARAVRGLGAAFALLAALVVTAALALPRLALLDPIGDAAVWRDWLGIGPAQLPVLAVGVVVWHADRALAGSPAGRPARAGALAVGIAATALLATGLPPVPRLLLPSAFGIALGAVVLGAMRLCAGRDAVSRSLAFLGGCSYGVYLFHVLVLHAFVALLPRTAGLPDGIALRWALLPVVLAASAGLAALLRRGVERPAIAWGEARLDGGRAGPPAVVTDRR
jgi:peptidoglycan/LPS O-acetylase OafA/YrhL